MAKIPTDTKINSIASLTDAKVAAKTAQFEKKGKESFRFDPYGPGVVPQAYYDTLREVHDKDYKEPTNG